MPSNDEHKLGAKPPHTKASSASDPSSTNTPHAQAALRSEEIAPSANYKRQRRVEDWFPN